MTLIVALLGCSVTGLAQPTQSPLSTPSSELVSGQLIGLEDAFWACDYLATTQGTSDISACTAIYEALKHRKFEGDFDRLVEWWRENKLAQHQRAHQLLGASHSATTRP